VHLHLWPIGKLKPELQIWHAIPQHGLQAQVDDTPYTASSIQAQTTATQRAEARQREYRAFHGSPHLLYVCKRQKVQRVDPLQHRRVHAVDHVVDDGKVAHVNMPDLRRMDTFALSGAVHVQMPGGPGWQQRAGSIAAAELCIPAGLQAGVTQAYSMWSTHLFHCTKCIAGVKVLPLDAAGHPGDQVIQDGRVQRRVLLALVFCTAETLLQMLRRLGRLTRRSQAPTDQFADANTPQ
jgi:hypothetical protein